MREIKFRGKPRNEMDKRPWVYGELVTIRQDGHPTKFIHIPCELFEKDPDEPYIEIIDGTEGEYTGLYDKNGKEICEGDILSFADQMTADDSLGADPNGFVYDETNRHAVIWDEKEGAWFPDTTNHPDNESWKYRRDTRFLMRDGFCVIIGNRFENPELLGKP